MLKEPTMAYHASKTDGPLIAGWLGIKMVHDWNTWIRKDPDLNRRQTIQIYQYQKQGDHGLSS